MTRMRCLNTILAVFGLIILCEFPLVQAATVDAIMLENVQADLAQKAGLTGKGVVIGVVSDGVEGYAAAQATGDLPATMDMVNNDPGIGSEGAAILEVIHEVAPQATLAFCTEYEEPESIDVSGCAQQLVNDFGAQVIVDDVATEAPYTFSPSSDSHNYDQLIGTDPSLIALHGAGNQHQESFTGEFVPVALTIGGTAYQVEDFGQAAGETSNPYETVTVDAGQMLNVYLCSNQNPDAPALSSNDVVGIWLLSPSGSVLASNQSNSYCITVNYTNSGSTAVTTNIVVGLLAENNAEPLALVMTVPSGGFDISPTLPINGSGGAGHQLGPSTNVYSIGAVNKGTLTVSSYSETGPATVYFSATETGLQNGVPNLSYTALAQPLVLNHPDLAGITNVDIGDVNNFGSNFFGTSAATPVVGGVVALMLQAGYDKTQIMTALESTAKPVPTVGQTSTGQSPDNWAPNDGYRLVQVWSALLNAGLPVPQPAISKPAPVSETINAGASVIFAGSCTETGGGTITGYSWNFGNGDSVVGLSTCGTVPASRTLVPTTGIPFAAIVLRSETVTAHGFLHSDATPRRVLRTRRRGATDAGAIAGFSPRCFAPSLARRLPTAWEWASMPRWRWRPIVCNGWAVIWCMAWRWRRYCFFNTGFRRCACAMMGKHCIPRSRSSP